MVNDLRTVSLPYPNKSGPTPMRLSDRFAPPKGEDTTSYLSGVVTVSNESSVTGSVTWKVSPRVLTTHVLGTYLFLTRCLERCSLEQRTSKPRRVVHKDNRSVPS